MIKILKLIIFFIIFLTITGVTEAKEKPLIITVPDYQAWDDIKNNKEISQELKDEIIKKTKIAKEIYLIAKEVILNNPLLEFSNKKINESKLIALACLPYEYSGAFIPIVGDSEDIGVDLILDIPHGFVEKNTMEISIGSIKTGNYLAVKVNIENYNSSNLKKIITDFLNDAPKIVSVKADEIINNEDSKVLYKISTNSGKHIFFTADYIGYRPNPEMNNFIIEEETPLKNGGNKYFVKTQGPNNMIFTFQYKNSEIEKIICDTDYKPNKSTEEEKIFTVFSEKGYGINFNFKWDKNGEVLIEVLPAVNPFEVDSKYIRPW